MKSWVAQRLEKVLTQGRTRPLILNCVVSDDDTDASEYTQSFVVKSQGLPEITPEALFNEVVGNLIASRLGLFVPEVALIRITDEFVESVRAQLANQGLRLDPGMGAGTKLIPGLANFVPSSSASIEEVEQMTTLYGFDLMVQNPDRRLGNPNCAVQNGKLLAFDFDMCFSFVLALKTHDACAVSEHGLASFHCCHEVLRAKKSAVSWNASLKALASITDEELSEFVSIVPAEWQRNATKIKAHVTTLRDQTDKLEMELLRSLS